MKRLDKLREVFFCIYNRNKPTTEEVADHVKLDATEAAPLVNELRSKGLISGGGRGGWVYDGPRKDRVAAGEAFNRKFPDFDKQRLALESELASLGRSEAVGANELRKPRRSKRAKAERRSSEPVTGDVAEIKAKLAAAKQEGDTKLAKKLRTVLRKMGHKGGLGG